MALSKKKIIGLSIFIAILIIGSLGLYYFNIRNTLNKKRADNLISQADKSEKRTIKITDRLEDIMKIDPGNDPQNVKRRYMETDSEIREGLDELDSAIFNLQDLRGLEVPTWQKNYADLRIQSLDRRIKMLDDMKRWFSRMELMADFLQRTTVARSKFDLGIEKLNEAIEDSNDNKYDRAKANASKGKQLFDEAQKLLNEAEKMEKDANLEPILNIVSSGQDFASLTIQLAEAGATDKIDEYNALAQKCEDAKPAVLKDWDVEIIKDPKKWSAKRNKKLDQSIRNYQSEAIQLKKNAVQLYRRNTE